MALKEEFLWQGSQNQILLWLVFVLYASLCNLCLPLALYSPPQHTHLHPFGMGITMETIVSLLLLRAAE